MFFFCESVQYSVSVSLLAHLERLFQLLGVAFDVVKLLMRKYCIWKILKMHYLSVGKLWNLMFFGREKSWKPVMKYLCLPWFVGIKCFMGEMPVVSPYLSLKALMTEMSLGNCVHCSVIMH